MANGPILHTLLCILFSAAASYASADALDTAPYRQSLQDGVDSGAYDQLAIGWIEGDERATWFLGKDTKPSITTAFEIGALTEIFTGVLFAQSEVAGKLRRQTTLREAMPGFPFVDARLAALTLGTLAQRRSGLPAIPANLFPASIDDPYADYSDASFSAFLAHGQLTSSSAAYSPLDFGLLAFAIAQSNATSVASVLHDNVFAPLKMTHTGFADTALIDGHSRGRVVPHWHFGALAGAAGLRSTVSDLLDFAQTNLRPLASPLRAALLLVRQPQDIDRPEIGTGWHIAETHSGDQTWPLLWRGSTTAGFSAFIGFRTDRQQALVILGNTDADLSGIGLAWLRAQDASPPPSAMITAAPSSDLSAYAGLYQIDSLNTELIVRSDGSTLSAQLLGSPSVPYREISEDMFAAHGEEMTLSFQREANKVTNVLITRGGVNLLAQRLTAQAPVLQRKIMSVSTARLAEYAGDFRIDAATFARISVDGGGLTLHLTGRATLPVAAFSQDHFTDVENSCEVAFKRNASGKVESVVLNFGGVDRRGVPTEWTVPSSAPK
ncbi:MAG: serine hydrolase [Rudaea sp.]